MDLETKVVHREKILEGKCESEEEKREYKWDIVWINVVLLALLHLGAVYGLCLRTELKWQSWLLVKVLMVFSNFGITGGAHRLWSHRTYQANTAYQILFAFFATLTYQNSIYIWCRDHRLHHKYTETDADPHNAKRGFFFCHVGWLLVRKHKDVKEKGKEIDMSDLEANPIVMFQHRYYYPLVFLVAVALPVLAPWFFWGESLKVSVFSVLMYSYIVAVNHTWCINSLAHLYGYKPYDKSIGPTENPYMMITGSGEGFHNYHHTFAWDYKAGEFGDDARNWTAYLINFFAKIGWVTNRKTVPQSIIDKRRTRTGDGSFRDRKLATYNLLGVGVEKQTLVNIKNNAVMLLILFVIW